MGTIAEKVPCELKDHRQQDLIKLLQYCNSFMVMQIKLLVLLLYFHKLNPDIGLSEERL